MTFALAVVAVALIVVAVILVAVARFERAVDRGVRSRREHARAISREREQVQLEVIQGGRRRRSSDRRSG